MEDHEIIDLYLARSENAIYETKAKYGGFCSRISWNILRNKEDAEECVSDTYFHTWNAIPPAKPEYLMAYLGKIVRNISLNLRKTKHTQKRGAGEYELAYEELSNVVAASALVEDVYDGVVLKDLLNRWLDHLPAEQRMVFVGRYWYFDSVSEIANKMGYSESKTRMILFRLRSGLKKYLESEGIDL